MSIDKNKKSAVVPVSLNDERLMDKIKKELNEAFDILLEMYTVQISIYYTLGYFADEIDSGLSGRFAESRGEGSINHADIVFGVRRTLKRSADIAHEHALYIAEFKDDLPKLDHKK